MKPYTEPEILRFPLEQLCLTIKAMGIADVRSFLQKALSPPPADNVQAALELLEKVNALNENFQITPLGQHISQIPTDVRIGKMLM
jgi:HrpA-like RNA helicase